MGWVNSALRPLYPGERDSVPILCVGTLCGGPGPNWTGAERPTSTGICFCFVFVLYAFLIVLLLLFIVTFHHTQNTNIHTPGGYFFLFSCTLSVLYPCLFLHLHCPALCLLSLPTTHKTKHPCPHRNFSVLHLYCCFVLIVPFVLYCTTHTTQTSVPLDSNPLSQQVSGLRHSPETARPLGSTGIRSPNRPTSSKSLYRLIYPGPLIYTYQ